MWQREPDAALVEGWIERALELAEDRSPNQAKALYARSAWSDDEPAAHALQAIAEQLGDPALRSLALASLANLAWGAGDFDRARAWTDEQLELLPELSDPTIAPELFSTPYSSTSAQPTFPPRRALGVARSDRKLLHEAATRFQAMGLDWHADETSKLLSSSLTV
jgi:hypothetical protein